MNATCDAVVVAGSLVNLTIAAMFVETKIELTAARWLL